MAMFLKQSLRILVIANAGAQSTLLSEIEARTSNLARTIESQLCVKFDEDTAVFAQESLVSISEKNAGDAAGRTELLDFISNVYRGDTGTVLELSIRGLALPVWVTAAFIGLMFFIACGTLFRRCRCYSKKHRRRIYGRAAAMSVLIISLVTICFSIISIVHSVNKIWNGSNLALCAIARGVATTLNGEEDGFVGIGPAIQKANELHAQLSRNSNFVREVDATMLKYADDVAESLDRIDASLALAQRAFHMNSSALAEEYHHCFGDVCNSASNNFTILRDSRYNSSIRARIHEHLRESDWAEALVKVQSQLDPDSAQVKHAINQVVQVLQSIMEGHYAELQTTWHPISEWVALVTPIIMMVIWTINAVFMLLFVLRRVTKSSSSASPVPQVSRSSGHNPYSRCFACTACNAFVCNCLCASVVFLLSGVLAVATMYSAQGCVLALNIDASTVVEMANAINYHIDDQTILIMNTTMTRCLHGDGMILQEIRPTCNSDICPTVDQIVREKLDNARGNIQRQIDEAADMALGRLLVDVPSSNLTDFLDHFPLEALIVVNFAEIIKNDNYSCLLTSKDLKVGLVSSLACEDATIEASVKDSWQDVIDDLPPNVILRMPINDTINETHVTIPGIGRFSRKFNKFMNRSEDPSTDICPHHAAHRSLASVISASLPTLPEIATHIDIPQDTLVDSVDLTKITPDLINGLLEKYKHEVADYVEAFDDSACDVSTAANNLLALKRRLRAQKIFDCATPCNVTQWAAHVKQLATNLTRDVPAVLEQVRSAVASIKSDISNRVSETFFDPAFKVLERTNCKYLRVAKDDILRGICHDSMDGVRQILYTYLALGATAFLLSLTLYLIWRYWSDNRAAWIQSGASSPKKYAPKRRTSTSRPSTSQPQAARPTRPSTSQPQAARPTRPSTSQPQAARPTRPSTSQPQAARPTRPSTSQPQAARPTRPPTSQPQAARPSTSDHPHSSAAHPSAARPSTSDHSHPSARRQPKQAQPDGLANMAEDRSDVDEYSCPWIESECPAPTAPPLPFGYDPFCMHVP